jgi:AhpD family alkylhydroperoxidase
MEAFSSFVRSTESGPALSSRQGAVINVALSVAAQCEWCIAWHVTDALKAGATEDELMEAGFLAVLMHGAPAMMYLTTLIDALEEFGNGGSGAHGSPAG